MNQESGDTICRQDSNSENVIEEYVFLTARIWSSTETSARVCVCGRGGGGGGGGSFMITLMLD